ncbi:MAG: membrane protein insertion efficiency factor YidD [Oscillospiraceae bacterium]|nr:membrane protein insertion efficiency factor YidD [Oscillospiraceae bacterium]
MKYIFIAFIKLYRVTLSRILPSSCRFTPSCSAYAIIAIERFGAVKGGYLAFWRILRCNPFSAGGEDLVPAVFSWRLSKKKVG